MFLYEMHLHTVESSKCGQAPAGESVQRYMQAGYAGAFISDHFLNGNSAVPEDIPTWEEKMHRFARGYEAARAAALGTDFQVFFAVEYCDPVTHKEYLTYGLDIDFFLQRPDIMDLRVPEYIDAVHAAGGLVSMAHPFRKASYIADTFPWDAVEKLDAMEVYNYHNADPEWNRMALRVCREKGKLPLSGSDDHRAQDAGQSALVLPRRAADARDLCAMVRARQYSLICAGRPVMLDVAEDALC